MRQNSATAGPARVIWINGTFGAGGKPRPPMSWDAGYPGRMLAQAGGERLAASLGLNAMPLAAICVFSDVYWGHKR